MAAQDVVAGQFGAWTPIGAEQTASGYEVAWKVPAPISIRSGTPTAAAITSQDIGAVSGTSTALESLETSFQQDLNGDGVIGLPTHDGDRGEWLDQPDRGWEPIFIFTTAAVGPLAEIWRRGRCGGSIWCLDADRRGADGKRL